MVKKTKVQPSGNDVKPAEAASAVVATHVPLADDTTPAAPKGKVADASRVAKRAAKPSPPATDAQSPTAATTPEKKAALSAKEDVVKQL